MPLHGFKFTGILDVAYHTKDYDYLVGNDAILLGHFDSNLYLFVLCFSPTICL